MNTKNILTAVKITMVILAVVFGAHIASAFSPWTPPTGTAPDKNVDAPINVGPSDQVKDGSLSVKSLSAYANSLFTNDPNVVIDPVTAGLINITSATASNILLRFQSNGGSGNISETSNTMFFNSNAAAGGNGGYVFSAGRGTHLVDISNTGNVGIGTVPTTNRLEVVGGPIKAAGGLIIEVRSANPTNPETGRMWLIQ